MRIVENCRVKSRDMPGSLDGMGAKIELWGSQLRFLDN